MRKVPPVFIVSFLFISISLFSFSQQTNKIVDSLLKEIEISKEDTTKVITLNTLSWQFIQMGRYSEAKNYAVQANSLAQTLDFKKGFASPPLPSTKLPPTCFAQQVATSIEL
jgi:hypothetical protein